MAWLSDLLQRILGKENSTEQETLKAFFPTFRRDLEDTAYSTGPGKWKEDTATSTGFWEPDNLMLPELPEEKLSDGHL